jgi:hypothetical protein
VPAGFTIRKATPCWFPVITHGHALASARRSAGRGSSCHARRALLWNLRTPAHGAPTGSGDVDLLAREPRRELPAVAPMVV